VLLSLTPALRAKPRTLLQLTNHLHSCLRLCAPDADWLSCLDGLPQLCNLLLICAFSLQETAAAIAAQNSSGCTYKAGLGCADHTHCQQLG
jgi:hypothetical protein